MTEPPRPFVSSTTKLAGVSVHEQQPTRRWIDSGLQRPSHARE